MAENLLDLTVILVIGRHRERAARALASVLGQDGIGRFEVLVADLDPGCGPIVGAGHPAVRFLPMPPATLFGTARAEALGQARGRIIAFLEEHARAEPGWARALLAAHAGGGWASVGPTVYNANPGVGLSDVIGLISYGLFYPTEGESTADGDRPFESEVLPGHNSSFQREILQRYEHELAAWFMNDNVLFTRLRQDGHRLAVAPGARVSHLNEVGLIPVMYAYFHYHRIYGCRRARVFNWSIVRQAAYVVLAPAIPLYFFAKFGRYLWRMRRSDLPFLLRHAPSVYLMQLAAAVGQAIGILIGVGHSDLLFTHCEVNAPRPWRTPLGDLAA